jgi:hypothetical protein
MKKGLAIFGIALLFFGAIFFGMYVNYTNTEIDLRERTESQKLVCEANFDKMFKVISQTAEIPQEFMEQAKNAFKEIYTPLMEGRYSNERGGALMSWISENNPQFDLNAISDLYKQLQRTIEANRQEFFLEQKKLIDMHREHLTYIQKFPNRAFLSDKKEVEITIITSTHTEKVFQEGKDDDIKLFKK